MDFIDEVFLEDACEGIQEVAELLRVKVGRCDGVDVVFIEACFCIECGVLMSVSLAEIGNTSQSFKLLEKVLFFSLVMMMKHFPCALRKDKEVLHVLSLMDVLTLVVARVQTSENGVLRQQIVSKELVGRRKRLA